MTVRRAILLVVILLLNISLVKAQPLQSRGLRMMQTLSRIANSYVDTVDVNMLEEEAIKEVVKQLDPHSTFVKKEDALRQKDHLNGSFVGIGIFYNFVADTPSVLQTVNYGPAFLSGIKTGDRIVSIDETPTVGQEVNGKTISKLLRGDEHTTVELGIVRKQEEKILQIKVSRERIDDSSVDAAFALSPTIGYLKLNRFAASSHEEVEEALSKFRAIGVTDLIFDLRDNGGGYLNSVVKIADNFLDENKMIVYTEGANKPKQGYYSSDEGIWKEGRVVMLINESSASASEILAGAIQDWDRGVIIGRRSYGKGLVQNSYTLYQGDVLRLTIAKYYTPSGRLIQKPYDKGIEAYSHELVDRYNRGELSNEDSIQFPHTDKFFTKQAKRVVYAGGGIMPDIFVPLDTKLYPEYYTDLKKGGRLYQMIDSFYLNSYVEIRKNYATFDEFRANYVVPPKFIETLKAQAGPSVSMSESKEQSAVVNLHIKANFARNLWSKKEYLQILQQFDDNVLKAVDVLNNPELYDNKLTVLK